MIETITPTATGMAVGIAYGLTGFFTKRDKGEKLNIKKLLRTIVLFGVAGAILQGDPSGAQLEQTVGQIGVVGVAFDMVYGKARRMYDESQEN